MFVYKTNQINYIYIRVTDIELWNCIIIHCSVQSNTVQEIVNEKNSFYKSDPTKYSELTYIFITL